MLCVHTDAVRTDAVRTDARTTEIFCRAANVHDKVATEQNLDTILHYHSYPAHTAADQTIRS